ncbi:MAG: RrF2 family transcriptional regulator [Lachnospiraceae bacterium]
MIITRETDYALRILRTLRDGKRHTMKALCEAEAIPQQFAYKIIAKLAKEGIVHNTRGSRGGCLLSCDLRELNLYQLLEIMGENYQINACMNPDYECTWERKCGNACEIRRKLGKIQRYLQDELANHSIYFLISGDETTQNG